MLGDSALLGDSTVLEVELNVSVGSDTLAKDGDACRVFILYYDSCCTPISHEETYLK